MVGIAIAGMARDHDRLAVHCRRQMSAAAVVADKKITPLQHRTYLADGCTADDDNVPR
jgi:hypothetical protein